MPEKTEWEIVDTPSEETRQSSPPPTPQQMMQNMLGKWWRWKIAGFIFAAGLALVFFLTVTSVAILVLVAAGIVSIGVGRVRQWLRRPGSAIREKR